MRTGMAHSHLIQLSEKSMRYLQPAFALLIAGVAFALSASAAERPNVVFIISDDLNCVLSGMGHPECQDSEPRCICQDRRHVHPRVLSVSALRAVTERPS